MCASAGYQGDWGDPGLDGEPGEAGAPGRNGLPGFPGSRGFPVSADVFSLSNVFYHRLFSSFALGVYFKQSLCCIFPF